MQPASYAVAQEIFRADYFPLIFPDNTWMTESVDISADSGSKTVTMAQEGEVPDVIFNKSDNNYGTASAVTDIKRSFDLDEVRSRPIYRSWTEEKVISYVKNTQNLLSLTNKVRAEIALRLLYCWSPTINTGAYQNILRTSGAARATDALGATNPRNGLSYVDLLNGMKVLDKLNIPTEGRVILVSPNMYADLLKIDQFVSILYNDKKPITNGVVGTILGATVYKTSRVVQYSTGATPLPQNPKSDNTFSLYAGNATDNEACFIWHRDYVIRCISPDTLVSMPEVHGGRELSVTTIAGGTVKYNNQQGVVAIVEQ